MKYELLSIKRKALRINLEESIYGTFAEIGAGQEVARTFFQVGGASGTVAKTMSAYDMAFSDSIYGKEESGRYVSLSRLEKMLQHEFGLLKERLTDEKYNQRRFFAFADTATTINYTRTNEPHCWMGVHFQLRPGGPVNEVMLHLRLKEDDALNQQRTIGAIGVNLLFAVFMYADSMENLVMSLMDNVTREQVEIDLCRIKGDDFLNIDNRLVALQLVKLCYTSATIFGPDKEVYQPKDRLYRKHILCLRGRFRPVTRVNLDMLEAGTKYYQTQHGASPDGLEILTELNLQSIETESENGVQDFLDRADILCNLGYDVLISNCAKHDKLVEYLGRCKPESISLILGILNIIELFKEENYTDAHRELLTYFGVIFRTQTRMLLYPYQPEPGGVIYNSQNLEVSASLQPLFAYLKTSGFMIDLPDYNPDVLQIFSPHVIEMIRSGKAGWEEQVPQQVAQMIRENCLFDYPCPI